MPEAPPQAPALARAVRSRSSAAATWLLCAIAAAAGVSASTSSALASAYPGGLDERGWELVTPIEKNGGEVGLPGTAGAGILQAAAQGGAIAYGSTASFGSAEGSLAVNQYVANRQTAGWATANITPGNVSGTYVGGAYRSFSSDLSRAVVAGPDACRDGGLAGCPAEGQPLGPGGPSGYRNLYLREGSTYTPLVTTANFSALPSQAAEFEPTYEGSSPNLRHIVFSSQGTIYEWNEGLIEAIGASPGAVAAGQGAVSADGSRVFLVEGGNLYLREAGITKLVAPEATFQAATADGSASVYLKETHLYRYEAAPETSTDLTPGGGAVSVLAASADGSVLYYVTAAGLFRRAGTAVTRLIAAGPSLLPPAAGHAVATADGSRLFFDTTAHLVPQDTNATTDVYEWELSGFGSCQNPSGCFGLISTGRTAGVAFAGASESGDDVFFTSPASILPIDPEARDLYDARVGGGFPEPEPQICLGDDCQGPAPAPDWSPPPTATLQGLPNHPVRFRKHRRHQRHRVRHRRHRRHSARQGTR